VNESPTLMDRIAERLDGFTPRERMLLGIMAGIFAVGISAIVVYTMTGTLRTLSADNNEKREALSNLLAERDTYAQARAESDALQAQLDENPLRLSSFIEARATRLGIRSPSEYVDRQEPRDDGIVELQTTAEFPGIELGDLDALLREFVGTEELVFVQEIAVQPARGRGNDGHQVEVTLVTYQRGGGDR